MKLSTKSPPNRQVFTKLDAHRRIAATVELVMLPDILGRRPAGYIHKVFTEEGQRGHGYASQLIERALRRAEKLGCYKVFLVCDENAVPLYQKLGFERNQVGMVKWLDQRR